MIYTVTLNPALDRTITINDFQIGKVNRISEIRNDPGGKGINVSKMLKNLGVESVAKGFLGRQTGEYINSRLRDEKIATDFLFIENPTRTNTKVVDNRNGTCTDINEPGEPVSEEAVRKLEGKLFSGLKKGDIVVFAGKGTPGMPDTLVGEWTTRCKSLGVRVFVDAEKQMLVHSMEACPFLIKPNIEELEEAIGEKLSSVREITVACRKVVERGITMVALSMGSRGAMFFSADEGYQCAGVKVKTVSTVGAGDAMMAALVYSVEYGLPWEEASRLSVAVSAAKVELEGTQMPMPGQAKKYMDKVNMTRLY